MSPTLETPIPWMEHRVPIACPVELVWRTFLDFNDWALRRGMSGALVWVAGGPWTVGSSFSLDLLVPQRVQVSGRVTMVDAPHQLRWISHGNGITDVHFLDFLAVGHSNTLLEGYGQLAGSPIRPCEPSRDENHRQAYAGLYERLRVECEARASRRGCEPSL